MPHLHRFHIPEPPTGDSFSLPPEEAHHALRVVRVQPGDRVALFDGQGREWLGQVAACTKREVTVGIEALREAPRPAPRLTLAVGRPNLDKSMEFIVRHGTELGVSQFVFFHAERSQRPPRHHDKWERLAVECCKQSGRLWLPAFAVAESLEAVLDRTADLLVLASIEGPYLPLSVVQGAPAVTLLVGPEGDFTEAETALACARGARRISLGPHVLRTEVAAMVAAALVQYEAGYLKPGPDLV